MKKASSPFFKSLFLQSFTDWQESYMDRLNKGYIELLSEDKNPSEKFWRLDKRIKEEMMFVLKDGEINLVIPHIVLVILSQAYAISLR